MDGFELEAVCKARRTGDYQMHTGPTGKPQAQLFRALKAFIEKQGQELPPGWKVFTKKRSGSNRVDYHFLSPEGQHFR